MADLIMANLANIVRPREVVVDSPGDSMRAQVQHGDLSWRLSAEDESAPDPVTSFLGSMGSCLLMSLTVAARARKIALGKTRASVRCNEKGHVKEIQVDLEIETSEDDERLHRLVEVAERGCHIRQLIRPDIPVAITIRKTKLAAE